MSDSFRPNGLQHVRLPCPSPTSGACSDSCPSSLWCHPTISPSVIHLIWIAIPFSRGSSWPRDRIQVSCITGWFFTIWATREGLMKILHNLHLKFLHILCFCTSVQIFNKNKGKTWSWFHLLCLLDLHSFGPTHTGTPKKCYYLNVSFLISLKPVPSAEPPQQFQVPMPPRCRPLDHLI